VPVTATALPVPSVPPALTVPLIRSACIASGVRWNSVIDTAPEEIVTPSAPIVAAAWPFTTGGDVVTIGMSPIDSSACGFTPSSACIV
jgi:hypothetical protein